MRLIILFSVSLMSSLVRSADQVTPIAKSGAASAATNIIYFNVTTTLETFANHKMIKSKGFLKETIDPTRHIFWHKFDLKADDGSGPLISFTDTFFQDASGKWQQNYGLAKGKDLTTPADVKILGPSEMTFSSSRQTEIAGLIEKGSGHFTSSQISGQGQLMAAQGKAIGKGTLSGSVITKAQYSNGLEVLSTMKSPSAKK